MATASAARRLEAGKKLRAKVPREAHAEWTPPAKRRDPVEILEEQAKTRIPELVPIRYGRMAESAFAFYRGGAAIMAADLASTPATGITVQSCGDAHVANFGIFAAPDRRLVFDLNDFDETHPAPFEWDVKRLGASMAIAARANGFTHPDQRAIVRATVQAYQRALSQLAEVSYLQAWYVRIEPEELLKRFGRELKAGSINTVRQGMAKAEKRTNLGTLDKLAYKVNGGYRLKPRPPVIVPVPRGQRREARKIVDDAIDGYVSTLPPERQIVVRHYRLVDVARKVSGVGSVGTDGYIVLMMGQRDDDPLFLQFKEAQESVLARHTSPSEYDTEGERVVRGQQIMQAAGDSFLGWYVGPLGKHFYIRQLRDKKGSLDTAVMSPNTLDYYGRLCGLCLARAHARSDDIARMSGYVGTGKTFARAIERFAMAYAEQNEQDYMAMLAAGEDGRITIERGV